MDLLSLYDEEFNRYLNLAKCLISQLRSREDRKICMKWIRKLLALKTRDVTVKKNRNDFFRYMLRVLDKGVMEDSLAYPQYDDMYGPGGMQKINTDNEFMSRWSLDKRTYVAAKALPGKGALVYMAVAKDPSLGWDIPQKRKKR